MPTEVLKAFCRIIRFYDLYLQCLKGQSSVSALFFEKSNMKKYVQDLRVVAKETPGSGYVLLKLSPLEGLLPEILPGQFVEILVPNADHTFLRRPISVNYVENNRLWLLIHEVGEGTRALGRLEEGSLLNCVYPLGNGFSSPEKVCENVLLVGGGVGTAPLLHYGRCLHESGKRVTFLLGGRSGRDLMQLPEFEKWGRVCVTTEDGSLGERGFVTNHSVLQTEKFDTVAMCGPKPMMVAMARLSAELGISHVEASLENLMACGLGACLCCVEKTADGHNVCVCKEGPVFQTKDLSWQS